MGLVRHLALRIVLVDLIEHPANHRWVFGIDVDPLVPELDLNHRRDGAVPAKFPAVINKSLIAGTSSPCFVVSPEERLVIA
jgi:hypothetical protein